MKGGAEGPAASLQLLLARHSTKGAIQVLIASASTAVSSSASVTLHAHKLRFHRHHFACRARPSSHPAVEGRTSYVETLLHTHVDARLATVTVPPQAPAVCTRLPTPTTALPPHAPHRASCAQVFAGTTPDGGAEDAGLPLFLHDQGRAALSALGVIEPAFPLLTVDRGSGPVPSAEVYGQAAEVLTRGSLMDGLLAEANMLPNLAIRSDVTVSGIDAAKGQLFVDGEVRASPLAPLIRVRPTSESGHLLNLYRMISAYAAKAQPAGSAVR